MKGGVTHIGFPGGPGSEEEGRPGELGQEEVGVEVLSDVSGVNFGRLLVSNCEAHVFLVVQVLGVEGMGIEIFTIGHLSVQVGYGRGLACEGGAYYLGTSRREGAEPLHN